ncbi:MAG: DUF4405 domain-containing protein [candidate division Zixibacteria bacterium]|nr:DUF4405 domain-containing protein [candidate division Zixibacteria bacterium]
MTRDRGRKIYDWLDSRVGLSSVVELLRQKQVPKHRHTTWYYFGGMTLFLFVIQIITGIFLLLYYRPTAEAAYESVKFIMTEVEFGWLMRSIHSWSANLMIAVMLIHMFSVFFLKSYRKPREVTWISGVLLLFLSLAFGFSGYLLPWNKLAYFATKVGTDIAGSIPVVGEPVLRLLRGGEEVTGATLTRFFGVHVAILPMIATFMLGLHLFLIQKHGMALPLKEAREKEAGGDLQNIPFMPNFLLRDAIGWIIALGFLVFLASVFPWELGEKADPLASAPAGIKPEWFFMFMFQTLKFIPGHILFIEGEILGILAFSTAGAILLFIPFIDKQANRLQDNRSLTIAGAIALIYFIIFTILGYIY